MDTYVDITVPYPNAKVYAALCVGGDVMFNLVVGTGLGDCWVLKNVVPNIIKHYF